MLYSSVYNLFVLIGHKAPFTHSLNVLENITSANDQVMYRYVLTNDSFCLIFTMKR